MRGTAAPQCTRLLGPELAGEQGRRRRRWESEAGQPQRVSRDVQERAHDVLAQRGEPPRRRGEDALPRTPVPAKSRGCAGDRAHHHPGASAVERVRQVHLRPAPLKAVALEESSFSDGAPAAIGWTAEQSSCSSPGSVSSLVRAPPPIVCLRLQDRHLHARASQPRGAHQTVRPRSDDDRLAHCETAAARCREELRPPVTSTGNAPVSSSHGWRVTMSATLT